MRAKKSLGQNFLHSKGALKKIADAGEIQEGEVVLEIGPGKGALTEFLLRAGAKVIAVEKDDLLFEFLKEKFKEPISEKKLFLFHADILDIDVKKLFIDCSLSTINYKLIANIPYYITGEILRKFLSAENKPSKIVVLVQKEVAERILARDKKESILSISVKCYGSPKNWGTVGKKNFNPAPRVDSAILAIENISGEVFKKEKINEEVFFTVLKKGFGMKRKTLENNLRGFISKEKIESVGISPKIRPEKLNVLDWINLSKTI